ncbi:hypothetical protein H8959_006824 [Pygathrix nigripes]
MATGAPGAGLRGRSGQAGWRVGADCRPGAATPMGEGLWQRGRLPLAGPRQPPTGCTRVSLRSFPRARRQPCAALRVLTSVYSSLVRPRARKSPNFRVQLDPGRRPSPGPGACLGQLAWQLLTTASSGFCSFHLQKGKEAAQVAETWFCSDQCQQHFLDVPTIKTPRPGLGPDSNPGGKEWDPLPRPHGPRGEPVGWAPLALCRGSRPPGA